MPVFSVGSAAAFAVTTSGNQTITGTKTFLGDATDSVPVIVQVAPGQTAATQSWRNSDGSSMASLSAAGTFSVYGASTNYGTVQIVASTDYGYIQSRNYHPTITPGSIISRVYHSAKDTAGAVWAAGEQRVINQSNTANAEESYYNIYTTSAGVSRETIRVGDATSIGAQLYVTTTNQPAQKGIVIRGSATQTANLQEWQSSSGTALSYIQSDGTIVTGTNGSFQAYGNALASGAGAAALYLRAPTTSTRGLIVRGNASQTTNLLEVQNNNATILTAVTPSGEFITSLWDRTSGIYLRTLEVGALNSAGTGFRTVRVAN